MIRNNKSNKYNYFNRIIKIRNETNNKTTTLLDCKLNNLYLISGMRKKKREREKNNSKFITLLLLLVIVL